MGGSHEDANAYIREMAERSGITGERLDKFMDFFHEEKRMRGMGGAAHDKKFAKRMIRQFLAEGR